LDEKKSSRRRFLKLAAALSGVGALLFASKIPQVHATTVAGYYYGDGLASQVIDTGLISLSSLTIVTLPEHGNAKRAYKTASMQGFETGAFLNGNKKDYGIELAGNKFRVDNPEFNVIGETYCWEARE